MGCPLSKVREECVFRILSGPNAAFLPPTDADGLPQQQLTPPTLPGRRNMSVVGGAAAGTSSTAEVGTTGGTTGGSSLVSPVLPPAAGTGARGPDEELESDSSESSGGEETPELVGSKRAFPPD
jgi:hypothetical protein